MSSKKDLDLRWNYSKNEYFSTILPPPNLTGTLHLGHMWNAILQDTLMRCHRKFLYEINEQGEKVYRCYWGAGVDHAGISLQIRVEEELRKKGKSKSDLSAEEFSKELNKWAKARKKDIEEQYDSLRYSFTSEEDELFKYTLSPESIRFCSSVFARLCDSGLIYRSKKLVNWDTKLKTAISDAEVDYRHVDSKIYTLKYFYAEKEYIPVATTRPETIFGDVAVFVHPEDDRYIHLIGREVEVPILKKKVKVIADEYVDRSFGTGAMKCTPAHDFDDGKLGEKHNLEVIQVFGEDLLMLVGPYKGEIYSEVREKVVEDLKKAGLLEKEEDCKSNVSYSSRSGAIVEPILSKQWFLRSSQMAKEALNYWKDHRSEMRLRNPSYRGRLEFILKNMEDWCISRQLEWGITVEFYLGPGDKISWFPRKDFNLCKVVLDTWFSSSLWPFLAMGTKEENLSAKYGSIPTLPISVLISGKDILLFWIAKMVFMCFFLVGRLPFKNIFLHGLVLDSQKRKMSKSLNNGVDPLKIIGKALDENRIISNDAVRLFFLSNTHDANDIVFSKDKLKYFCNILYKFRQAYKFYKSEEKEYGDGKNHDSFWDSIHNYEHAFFRELKSASEELVSNLREDFNFSKAVDKALFFFKECFFNRYLATYKLFKKVKKRNFVFFRMVWWTMMDMFEILIPDFFRELSSDFENNIKEVGKGLPWNDINSSISLVSLSWWFEYLKIFTDLNNRLKFPEDCEIEATIYVDCELEDSSDSLSYLALIGHSVKEIRSLSDRNACEFREDVIILTVRLENMNMIFELELPESERDKVVQYRKLVKEEANWLRKEIVFLTNRMKGFNHLTPRPLKEEVQNKLNRYQEDLKCYEINYGV